MTGLEKILKAIEADASSQAEGVITHAKAEAEDIIKTAKIETEKKCAEIALKSDADAKAVLSRAESAGMLQEKKIILDAKQQIISNIIANAKNSLAKLPDSEYAEVILRMVKKYALNKSGVILFSEADKKRLPMDLNDRLINVLSQNPGTSLIVSEEYVNIDGGFVLKYGDVEENCSFDALFNAAKEELQDKVNSILFSTMEETHGSRQTNV